MRTLQMAVLALGTCLTGMGAVTYQLPTEDGTAETAMGPVGSPTGEAYLIWMNHFVVQAGGENIKQIQISYGCTNPACQYPAPFSTPFSTYPMYLWQGTSNNPTGATLLSQTSSVTIQAGDANTNTFITMDLNPPCCLVAGTHIFVGTQVNLAGLGPGFLPAAIDMTPGNSPGESWFQFGTTAVIPDITTLGGGFRPLIEGNFLIRAVGEECPEPATWGMGVLGVLTVLLARRR